MTTYHRWLCNVKNELKSISEVDADFLDNLQHHNIKVKDKLFFLVLDPKSSRFNSDILFMQPQRIKNFDHWKKANNLPVCKEFLVHVFFGSLESQEMSMRIQKVF